MNLNDPDKLKAFITKGVHHYHIYYGFQYTTAVDWEKGVWVLVKNQEGYTIAEGHFYHPQSLAVCVDHWKTLYNIPAEASERPPKR